MITKLRTTPILVSVLLYAVAVMAQAQTPVATSLEGKEVNVARQDQPQKKPAQELEAQKTEPEPQRSVDATVRPDPDPKNSQPPGSKADRGLSRIENSKLLERIKPYLHHPNLHPRFGGIGDGSGFGLGIELTNDVSKSPNLKVSALVQGTFRWYLLTNAGISFDPTRKGRERFQLDFFGRYQLRPRENFYGLGPDSLRSNRSNYNLQERGFNFAALYKLTKSLQVGVGLDYSSTRIFAGEDARFANALTLFPNLPGAIRGASLLSPQAFITFDKRNAKDGATKGVYATFIASSNDSVGKDDFGFVNLRFDTRGYLPLGTPRHVLAARLLGNFNDAKGGSQIPFFRLARLGDSQTLRGYKALRFYGQNALAASIEYRAELVPYLGVVTFTDFGQVFDRQSQLTSQNLHATWGGGIDFKSKKSTLFRILVGKSGEGVRLILGFGPTF